MLSIVIATHNSERMLAPTLTALVPGAVAGIVSEVIVADFGSTDGTVAIADAAGCRVVAATTKAASLRTGAGAARSRWLLFGRPGFVPEPHWTDAVARFVESAGGDVDPPAATFARAASAMAWPRTARAILGRVAALILRTPDPDRGLLVSKRGYEMLGGHRDAVHDCEADLMRRIGGSRITILDCGAMPPPRLAVRADG
jgi:glycosyltransferase involved in cell wall biosynthesis